MTYQVLARKWRPKIFDDVIAQDHVTKTLKNAILNSKVAQAYLLTGTRGVGKTTIARIFAKSLMCSNKKDGFNPCLECDVCQSVESGNSIDYIEIDGASNNKVENIRELIDNVQYLPTSGEYKIYVIDEVHMLTTNAFNALLKTLEEPPKHVVFVFATTDPQKLLGTVISRCQRLDLKNVEASVLKEHIKKIAKTEGIKFQNDNVIQVLANLGNGSVRDTLSLLDQVLSLSDDNFITEDSLTMSVGLARMSSVDNLILSILAADRSSTQKFFGEILQENINLKNFSMQLIERFYYIIQNSDNQNEMNELFGQDIIGHLYSSELLWIYETLLKESHWALNSIVPNKAFELILTKLTMRRELLTNESSPKIQIEYKKKTELKPAVKLEEKPIVVEEIKLEQALDLSWLGFVESVTKVNQPLGINLEKGNLISPIEKTASGINLAIGYNDDAKIFYDYISSTENKRVLIDIAANFFKTEIKDINLSLNFLNTKEAEKINFRSHSEVATKIEESNAENRKNALINNKYIKEAENLFNAKVSDIRLNEKE